jgi:hypothetical protein
MKLSKSTSGHARPTTDSAINIQSVTGTRARSRRAAERGYNRKLSTRTMSRKLAR